MTPKYPEIEVHLVNRDGLLGQGGNTYNAAFNLIESVYEALRHNNVPESELEAFREEATSGDYDYVLPTCEKWVTTLL